MNTTAHDEKKEQSKREIEREGRGAGADNRACVTVVAVI